MKRGKYFLKPLLMLAVTLMSTGSLMAQVSQEVINIMDKCSKTMSDARGVQLNMEVKMSYLILSMTGDCTLSTKGDKYVSTFKTKILGREMYIEVGTDGEQVWRYTKALQTKDDKARKDSLIISPMDPNRKKEMGEIKIEIEIYKDYNKADLKQKNGKYEITFTKPKKKDDPKKVLMIVNQKDYMLHEMSTKESGASMSMKVKGMRKGLPDSTFVLDPKKYPGAVVVRK